MPPKGTTKGSTSMVAQSSTSRIPFKKRSRQSQIPSLPWPLRDEAMQTRYHMLTKRPISCTRYMDDAAIDFLGLTDQIHELLNNIGWIELASRRPPTYKEITLEFLSSLSCDLNSFDTEDLGRIQFRLMGREYEMNVKEFNELFGFHTDGEQMIPVQFSMRDAWFELTGIRDYHTSNSRDTKLFSPALRYMHKFMALSVFGRGESTTVVSKKELYLLWAMQHGVRINSGHWIIHHMQYVAKQESGKICVGGIVTMIARAIELQFNSSIHTQVKGQQTIDLDMLVHMHMCKEVEGRYQLIEEQDNVHPRRNQALHEDEMYDQAEASHRSSAPQASVPIETQVSQPNATTLDMLMAKLNEISSYQQATNARLDKLAEELREFESATGVKLANIESKLVNLAVDSESEDD